MADMHKYIYAQTACFFFNTLEYFVVFFFKMSSYPLLVLQAYLLFVLVMVGAVQASEATRVSSSLGPLLVAVIAASVLGIVLVAAWDWLLGALKRLEPR